MAIGSGLGSSFGLSTETTYGTYVAPTTFLFHESADLQPTDGRVTAPTIKAGGLGPAPRTTCRPRTTPARTSRPTW